MNQAEAIHELPATIVPKLLLDEAQAHATALNGSIASLDATNNEAHIAEAGPHADGLLRVLLPLEAVLRVEAAGGMRDADSAAVDAVTQIAERHATAISRLEAEVAARQAELEELSAEIDQRQVQLESIAADTATDTGRIQAKIEAQEADVDVLHEELRSSFQQRLAETIQTAEAAFARSSQAAEDTLTEGLSAIEQNRRRTDDLVGILSTSTLAAGYKEDSEAEAGQAARLQRRAVTAGGLLAVGLLIYALASGDASAEDNLSRLPFAVAVGGVSVYLARLAKSHQDKADLYRRTYHQLKTFEPYLQPLPEQARHALRISHSAHFFGEVSTSETLRTSPATRNTVGPDLRFAEGSKSRHQALATRCIPIHISLA